MITLLMKLGIGQRLAKLIVYVAVPLLILIAFYLLLDAYGDSRYREGETATDVKWIEARERLQRQAAASATKADDAAAVRVEQFERQVQEERERIDAATENGSSPLDVLFGG